MISDLLMFGGYPSLDPGYSQTKQCSNAATLQFAEKIPKHDPGWSLVGYYIVLPAIYLYSYIERDRENEL